MKGRDCNYKQFLPFELYLWILSFILYNSFDFFFIFVAHT